MLEPKDGLSAEDLLLELAGRMEADGGMPGATMEARVGATVAALFAFLSRGHTARAGAFRSHVQRLMSFLESAHGVRGGRRRMQTAALRFAREGRAPAGDWLKSASGSVDPWKEMARVLEEQRAGTAV
jgi:hypothetical protein